MFKETFRQPGMILSNTDLAMQHILNYLVAVSIKGNSHSFNALPALKPGGLNQNTYQFIYKNKQNEIN